MLYVTNFIQVSNNSSIFQRYCLKKMLYIFRDRKSAFYSIIVNKLFVAQLEIDKKRIIVMDINFDTAIKFEFLFALPRYQRNYKNIQIIVFFKRRLFYVFYLLHSKNICLYLLPEEKNKNILTVLKCLCKDFILKHFR